MPDRRKGKKKEHLSGMEICFRTISFLVSSFKRKGYGTV